MNLKQDIHAIHHTFLYKNNGQCQHLRRILQFCTIQILVPPDFSL